MQLAYNNGVIKTDPQSFHRVIDLRNTVNMTQI